jgi:hypothetical protein
VTDTHTDHATDEGTDSALVHDAPHRDVAAHGEVDAHDEHGHGASTLGPIDWGTWAYALVGAIGGVIVLAFFVFALGGLPS